QRSEQVMALVELFLEVQRFGGTGTGDFTLHHGVFHAQMALDFLLYEKRFIRAGQFSDEPGAGVLVIDGPDLKGAVHVAARAPGWAQSPGLRRAVELPDTL